VKVIVREHPKKEKEKKKTAPPNIGWLVRSFLSLSLSLSAFSPERI
jgi:hypothetical protein